MATVAGAAQNLRSRNHQRQEQVMSDHGDRNIGSAPSGSQPADTRLLDEIIDLIVGEAGHNLYPLWPVHAGLVRSTQPSSSTCGRPLRPHVTHHESIELAWPYSSTSASRITL